jgi:hypothetical protein
MPQFADDIAACPSDARQVEGFGLVQLNRRRVGKNPLQLVANTPAQIV